MAVFKCKMCGGNLDISDGLSVTTCEYCGTKQTVPKAKDEIVANLFNRANNLRLKCAFDKAEQVYEKILDIDNMDPEAHWGIVLCKYGIEYVDDPKTDTRIPTCHRTLYEAVLTDVNYLSAIENADEEQKSLYLEEAKVIDELQKNILHIVNNEEPFDVFLCYKETDENGNRTVDSAITNDIYYQLTQEGFKVFYAPITLEDKLGHEYEPYIFAALNSAKVMLVVGTKPEYFDSVWVRNEWSRFLKAMKNDRSKLLIPCYKDMDAYELPDEFAHLQAQDMGRIGFMSDIIRGLKKVFHWEAQPQFVPTENKRKPANKPKRTKTFWANLKNKFRSNYHLAFPLPKLTAVFSVFTIVFYIYFIYFLIHASVVNYDDEILMFSLIGLPFVVPLFIYTKIIRRKTTAIILEVIGLLWNSFLYSFLYFFDIPYAIETGIFSVTVLMSLLCLAWTVLVCCAKRIENKSQPKKKGYITVILLVVSIALTAALETYGIPFIDYQFAKVFYYTGAYEYANIYFTALNHYQNSDDFAKDSLYMQAQNLIEQGNYETAITILERIPGYKDAENLKNTALYHNAESLFKAKKYNEAIKILIELEDFTGAKALLADIQREINNIASEMIHAADYTECTVKQLYEDPNKYDGKKVVVTAWKEVCYFYSESVDGLFYDFLLCDDLTQYEDNSDGLPFHKVYRYYKNFIRPFNTPYVGARGFSSVCYTDISEEKSMIRVYGTFSYHPNSTEGGYVSDPHVYNLDVDYYLDDMCLMLAENDN